MFYSYGCFFFLFYLFLLLFFFFTSKQDDYYDNNPMLCAALCCGGWVTSCSFAVKKAFNIIDKADAVCEFHSEMV